MSGTPIEVLDSEGNSHSLSAVSVAVDCGNDCRLNVVFSRSRHGMSRLCIEARAEGGRLPVLRTHATGAHSVYVDLDWAG